MLFRKRGSGYITYHVTKSGELVIGTRNAALVRVLEWATGQKPERVGAASFRFRFPAPGAGGEQSGM